MMRHLPGTLDPKDFNPRDYDEKFLVARNIKISDTDIRDDFRKGMKLLEYIVNNSFKAASMQGPRSLERRLSDESSAIYARVHDELIYFVFHAFTDMSKSNPLAKVSFREWHDGICMRMIDICKDLKNEDGSSAWTYGNSQKMLNLAIKYLAVITKRARVLDIGSPWSFTLLAGEIFFGIYDQLDIPVDSYIIKASWNHNTNHTKKLVLPSRGGSVVPAANIEAWNSMSYRMVKPWTQWDRDDYLRYAEASHEVFDRPLDWEGYAWTETKEFYKQKAFAV